MGKKETTKMCHNDCTTEREKESQWIVPNRINETLSDAEVYTQPKIANILTNWHGMTRCALEVARFYVKWATKVDSCRRSGTNIYCSLFFLRHLRLYYHLVPSYLGRFRNNPVINHIYLVGTRNKMTPTLGRFW